MDPFLTLSQPEYLEIVMTPEVREDTLPGEVHSKDFGAASFESRLSGEKLTKTLRSLDYKADPRAAAPYFTNGLGLEQFYNRWVEAGTKLPNKVRPYAPASS